MKSPVFRLLLTLVAPLLASSVVLAKMPAVPCLSGEQVALAVQEDWDHLQPLIQTVPLPLKLVYTDMKQPVLGYADFTKNGEVSIHLSGHLCRDLLYRDEISLLMCHELGHVAGGGPVMDLPNAAGLGMSAEGQADFFATSSCLPNLWAQANNLSFLEKAKEFPELLSICPEEGKTPEQRGLCMRIALAGYNFALYIRKGNVEDSEGMFPPKDPGAIPKLGVHDKGVVSKTLLREHPKPQCRLDTFLIGLNCQALSTPANYSINPDAPLSCQRTAAEVVRPACWFANP